MVLLGALGVLAGSLASGCGGSAQDAHEPQGRFPVQILNASFPARQSIARSSRLVLKVRNTGLRTVPNVAISVDSFSYTNPYPGLASRQQPVWIVDEGPGAIPKRPVQTQAVDPPGSGQTAYVNTWALGPLPPGRTQTFVWHVTPVKAGLHRVNFAVAAGLNGKARARLAGDGIPAGHFTVAILPKPPPKHVDPETGRVAPGPYPVAH